MSILVAVAFFVGQRVDRERASRQRAEAYAAYVLHGQEEERQRIARDLHDETIQSLVLVCRQLDSVKDNSPALPPPVSDGLQAARSTVEHVVTELRDFARALRPPILDDLGMVASVRRLLMDFTERTRIEGELKVSGESRRLSPDAEIGLFRITQEALWNVERHAGATRVTVSLLFAHKETSLEVADNGVGFAAAPVPSEFATRGKLGIMGMQERAELLGGRFEIQSSQVKGTRVITSIPL
jgi:signal transduction histidine kinase